MLPAGGILEQARKARDPRFDGRFFVAVRSTGIYCRPICPVKCRERKMSPFLNPLRLPVKQVIDPACAVGRRLHQVRPPGEERPRRSVVR